jgi:hypothetical protein
MCGRSGIARSHSFRVSGFLRSRVLLVIVIESYAADHEQEHEHDYDGREEVTLSTLAYISR